MDYNLSERQKKLLLSIINEFIDTAEAVGSISLQSKYNLPVSTATIRNEMAELVLLGYLYQKHLSSGRIPTTKGWRFFVESLKALGEELDNSSKEEIDTGLMKVKPDLDSLIRSSLNSLSQISHNAAIALIGNDLHYSGLSELVNIPEFRDIDNLKRVLTILEDYTTLSDMLNSETIDDETKVLISEETGIEMFNEYAIVFSQIRVNGINKGCIAIIGPNRMRYNTVITAVEYATSKIRSLLSENY